MKELRSVFRSLGYFDVLQLYIYIYICTYLHICIYVHILVVFDGVLSVHLAV